MTIQPASKHSEIPGDSLINMTVAGQPAGSNNMEPAFDENIIQENNIKISLVPSRRKKVKKVNVIIEGQFNIGNAQLVKDNCCKLLQHFDYVSITLKNIEDLDLAAIQLIHVLKAAPSLSQKTITIDSELSKEDRLLIGSAGLSEILMKQ